MVYSLLETYKWILEKQVISEEGILVPEVVSWVTDKVKPTHTCSLDLGSSLSKPHKINAG